MFLVRFVRHDSIRHRIGEKRTIGEEDIESTVVVVIKQRHTTTHGLDQVLIGSGRVLLREIDVTLGCNIDKLHVRRGLSNRKERGRKHRAHPNDHPKDRAQSQKTRGRTTHALLPDGVRLGSWTCCAASSPTHCSPGRVW